MEYCCKPSFIAIKLLVLGLVLILVRLYTAWDIWVVLGVILIIKAVLVLIMPMHYHSDAKIKMPKKR